LITTLIAGSVFIHAHDRRRLATTFNPGVGAPTRFGPFEGPEGAVGPVWYGGDSQAVAIAERLFHDRPLADAFLPLSGTEAS